MIQLLKKTYNQCCSSINKWLLPKKSNEQNYHLNNEIVAIILILISTFLLFAMLSFSPLDQEKILGDNFVNWLGAVGSFLSSKLLYFFGFFALCFPITLALVSYTLFFNKKLPISRNKFLGLSLFLLGFMPLAMQVYPHEIKKSFLISGIMGYKFSNFFIDLFSYFGLWFFSIFFILIALVLLLDKPIISQFIKLCLSKKVVPTSRKCAAISILPPVINQKKDALTILPVKINFGNESKYNESDIEIIAQEKKIKISDLKLTQELLPKETSFALPPLNLLDYDEPSSKSLAPELLKKEADRLQQAFLQFGIEGKIRQIRVGPVVTNYEFIPAPGIKLSRIAALSDDIAMAMSAVQVRIVTPLPGKGAVGIEVPNEKRETVYLKEIVADEKYIKDSSKLCMAVGKDVEGNPYFMNLLDMPHILIAGTTGSGKSVSVNAMICSILYRATPKDVRFLMIDPKMLELSIYSGIPHLLLPPIIDAKKAVNALRWITKEMDERYNLMKEALVRDIKTYNEVVKSLEHKTVSGRKHEHLPYIVVVIDEYADLLAVAGKEVESYIMRLAQKARACGIHVMLATQRPSVDVITGVIKANFPVRMSFRLASSHDSKTIINRTGAEKLLGKGDVLIMPPGSSDIFRVHGAFISERELNRVVNFLKENNASQYREDIADFAEEVVSSSVELADNNDEKFSEALSIVKQHNRCSTSFLQRHLSIGYNRAARIVEQMEKKGLVGPVLNARGDREIFIS